MKSYVNQFILIGKCLKEPTLNHSECKIEGPALLLSQGSVTNIYQRQPCYIQIKHQTKDANQYY